jgi:hypothetical protein
VKTHQNKGIYFASGFKSIKLNKNKSNPVETCSVVMMYHKTTTSLDAQKM